VTSSAIVGGNKALRWPREEGARKWDSRKSGFKRTQKVVRLSCRCYYDDSSEKSKWLEGETIFGARGTAEEGLPTGQPSARWTSLKPREADAREEEDRRVNQPTGKLRKKKIEGASRNQ